MPKRRDGLTACFLERRLPLRRELFHRATGVTVVLEQTPDGALSILATQRDGSRLVDVTTRPGPTGDTN